MKRLVSHSWAICETCGDDYHGPHAPSWARDHVRKTGHQVSVETRVRYIPEKAK